MSRALTRCPVGSGWQRAEGPPNAQRGGELAVQGNVRHARAQCGLDPAMPRNVRHAHAQCGLDPAMPRNVRHAHA
ncbi:hypothetical protein GCM10010166_21190 [Couchioplanes caeruleus subsp. azureus]|nr:hypothetical protein GCM10010166_21190 [Couchioplanes caeruleus subsp. azureus]